MSTVRDLLFDSRGRAAPRRLAILMLSLAGLGLTGCRSMNPCGQPSLCASPARNPFQKLTDRFTNRHARSSTVVCEPGLIGAPIDGCGTSTFSNGTIVSPGALPTEDAPPLDLSPVNPSSGTTSGSSLPPEASRLTPPANSGPNKALYQSYKPPGGSPSARREAAPGASASPALAARPSAPAASAANDPLANIPQLDTPTDLKPVDRLSSDSKPRARPTDPDPDNPPRGLELTVPTTPQSEPGTPVASLAPGIQSFKVVEPRLAGGSLPADNGWTWLTEQGGYRTVIDLRPTSEVRSSDVATANTLGLRYVALPTPDDQLDKPEHLARFAAEIGQDASRPIYFFDTDGSRAAVIWYLHQVVNQKLATDQAQRAVADIGPRNEALWSRATRMLDELRSARPASTSAAPEPPASAVPDKEASQQPALTTVAR